mgnify:CR=1 FL=1
MQYISNYFDRASARRVYNSINAHMLRIISDGFDSLPHDHHTTIIWYMYRNKLPINVGITVGQNVVGLPLSHLDALITTYFATDDAPALRHQLFQESRDAMFPQHALFSSDGDFGDYYEIENKTL